MTAAVRVGAYNPDNTRYLTETLIQRRNAILRRYLTRLSPLTKLEIRGGLLCGVDLARKSQVVPRESTRLPGSNVQRVALHRSNSI
ncbi:MAG TPA: hypothetical protein VKP30_29575 [Polyangiaceae bacterium]|nr:hypothetical protein [Polyangiaceae bacterium]